MGDLGPLDVYETLEQDVVQSYYNVLELMEPEDIAPNLVDIYEDYHMTVIDNVECCYQEFFGDGAEIRGSLLAGIGISMQNIPHISIVCRVLNTFRLGYIYRGQLYNLAPQGLLRPRILLWHE